MIRRITAVRLRKVGACSRETLRFKRMFPAGAAINAENAARCVKSFVAASFFAARILLTPVQRAQMHKLSAKKCNHLVGYCNHMAFILRTVKAPTAKDYKPPAKTAS